MQSAVHWGKAPPSQGPQTPLARSPAGHRQRAAHACPQRRRPLLPPAAAPGAGNQRSRSVPERSAGRAAQPSPSWQLGDKGIPAGEGNLPHCRPLPSEACAGCRFKASMLSLRRDRKPPRGWVGARGWFLLGVRHAWAAEQQPQGPRRSLGKLRPKSSPAPALPSLCLQEGAINHAPVSAGLCSSPRVSPGPARTPWLPLHLYNRRQHRLCQPHLQRAGWSDDGPHRPHRQRGRGPAPSPLRRRLRLSRGTEMLPNPSPLGQEGSCPRRLSSAAR